MARNNVNYTVDGILTNSSHETRAAYDELNKLQNVDIMAEANKSFDRSIFDYKEWANHDVKYYDLNRRETQQRLQKCNDYYTISSMMDFLTPLEHGVDFKSVFSCWFMYKSAEMMNPDLQMDMSRAFLNIRKEIVNKYDSFSSKHPVLGSFGEPMMKALEKKALNASSDNLVTGVGDAVKNDRIDDMVMTPRQVAALKMNFMEQCYVDVRQPGSNAKMVRDCLSDYNKALDHLSQIAKNSGFDMSVVAAEERYLVGLKIAENPSYKCVFEETSDIYGVSPVHEKDGVTWAGRFETADSHNYTTGGHTKLGAFRIRLSIDENRYVISMKTHAEEFGAMMHYLDSDECHEVMSPSRIKYVKKELQSDIESYQKMLSINMKDDGIHAKKFTELWQQNFSDVYEDTLMNPEMHQDVILSFGSEIERIVNKEVLEKAGVAFDSDVEKFLSNDDSELDATESLRALQAEAERLNRKLTSIHGVVDNMRKNYMEAMTDSEIHKLFIHTGTNLEQSNLQRGYYSRQGLSYGKSVETSPESQQTNVSERGTEVIVEEQISDDCIEHDI